MSNNYTFQVVDQNNLVSTTLEASIATCAQYVIGLIGRYIEWKGIIDFVVDIRPAAELTWSDADGLLPSITQPIWNGSAWLNGTLMECLTGIDPDGARPDAGCTIYLADDGSIKNYGSPVWFDPNPAFEVDPAVPAGMHDFVGILTHEIFHSLGFVWFTKEWTDRIVTQSGIDYFSGANSTALYGAAVPFQSGFDHYGYTQDPSIPIARGLMFQWGNYGQNRLDLGRLDLAILADLGLTVKGYDGLALLELIDTATDLTGTAAGETLYGDYHANQLSGLAGDDRIEAGAGNDQIGGGDGNDVLMGGSGVDSFDGGANDTTLNPASLYGDRVSFFEPRATQGAVADLRTGIISNDGFGNVETMTNVESLGGDTAFADTFYGNDGRNALVGSQGDRLFGLGGDDLIYVNAAPAIADGGAGNDILFLQAGPWYEPDSDGDGFAELASPWPVGYYVDLGTGAIQREFWFDYGSVLGFETVVGSDLADHLVGSAGANIFRGGGGGDSMLGMEGDDQLFGDDGNDSLYGGRGVDSFDGGANEATFNLTALVGDQINFLDLEATQGVVADLRTGIISNDGFGNVETMTNVESLGGDTAFVDTYYGNDGSNGLTASRGDQLYGFGGDDIIRVRAAPGTADGGSGTDILVLDAGTWLLPDSNGDGRAEIAAAATSGWEVDLAGGSIFDGHGNSGFVQGFESVLGSALDDDLFGNGLANVIDGRGGADVLLGEAGSDTLAGGDGDDVILGGDGDDIVNGGGGNDFMRGGSGIDSFDGGADDGAFTDGSIGYGDRLSFYEQRATQGVVADLRTGIISNDGFGNAETMTGIETLGADTAYADTLYGNDSINALLAGLGDSLYGFGGDDLFQLSSAAALVDGGDGVDLLDLSVIAGGFRPDSNGDGAAELAPAMASGWRADLTAGTLRDGYGNVGTVTGIENLIGSELGDEFRGSAAANRLEGRAGNDFLLLQDGGSDTALGGDGNDVLYFGTALSAGDVADGGAGRDSVVLQGNVTVALSSTNLVNIESLSLQSGSNTRYGDTANNFYDFNVTMADGNVAAGVQLIVNGQSLRTGEDMTFDGSAEHDGRFLVYAGHGVDTLKGGDGNDIFYFEGHRWSAGDSVDGGAGRDSVVIAGVNGINHFDFGAASFANIESISVNNRLASDPSQKPSYEMVLANGNVTSGGNLILNGNSLTDPTQTLSFDGSAVTGGSLTMFAGAGDDVLIGGAGADLLYGGGGGDELSGGGGADIFQYRSTSESAGANPDSILDFESGFDKIDLHLIDANTNLAGDQAFAWIGSDAFNGSAGELRVFESGGTWFVEGDTDGNGLADFALTATTQNGAALGQGDFLP